MSYCSYWEFSCNYCNYMTFCNYWESTIVEIIGNTWLIAIIADWYNCIAIAILLLWCQTIQIILLWCQTIAIFAMLLVPTLDTPRGAAASLFIWLTL
jgi:hypothetical protein